MPVRARSENRSSCACSIGRRCTSRSPKTSSRSRVRAAWIAACRFARATPAVPVVNLIPEWNDLVYRGRWKDALKALHTTNNFPEFTGRLCPAPCEGACVLGINEDPVSIRVIEWNIIDRGFNEGLVVPDPAGRARPARPWRSSAPVRRGWLPRSNWRVRAISVTVFEKADRIGGLLRYGIPDFKMEKWVIDRRLEQMKAEGVEFQDRRRRSARTSPASSCARQFDAVGLTMGAEQARELPIPGRELKGVHLAMDYLTQQNKRTAGIPVTRRADHGEGQARRHHRRRRYRIGLSGHRAPSRLRGSASVRVAAGAAAAARRFDPLAALADAAAHVACA